MMESDMAITSHSNIYHYATLLCKNQVKSYKLEYKKWQAGIQIDVVKMYNNGRKRAMKLCNVHYAQFERQYFVKYAKACIVTPKCGRVPPNPYVYNKKGE